MDSAEEKIVFTTSLLDLPPEVLISHLGKYLKLRDILNFRCYSRYSKEVGNAMLSNLKRLNISGKFPANELQFRLVLQECHRLRKIYLPDGLRDIFSDELIAELLSNNPLLEAIDLGEMPGFTRKALVPLANCKNLVKLYIWGHFRRDGFLETIGTNNHFLEANFNFAWEQNEDIQDVWEFLKKQPRLQRLSLPGLYGFFGYIFFYEKILATIAEVCRELCYLEIPWDIRTPQYHNALCKIADNCPKLHTIDFAYYATISDDLVCELKSRDVEVVGNYSYPPYETRDSDVSCASDDSFEGYAINNYIGLRESDFDYNSSDFEDSDDY